MIAALICFCPTAEPKAYKFLQQFVENWMDVPVYRGSKACKEFLDKFKDYPMGPESSYELQKFISKSSKYIAIVGWDEKKIRWADIAHNSAKSKIDAENIIYQFA